MDIATGMLLASSVINFSSITGASWFPVAVICIFIGMWMRKFL